MQRPSKTHSLKDIKGGTFEVTFSKGRPIPGTNDLYIGRLGDNKIPTVYHLLSNTSAVDYWYDFAMEHTSPHLLRVLGKTTEAVPEKVIIFTEVVEGTIADWVMKNPLTNSLGCLAAPFINILLSLLQGMIYFDRQLKRVHGDIRAESIFVVEGKAKLANVLAPARKPTYNDDIKSLCRMVELLFVMKNVQLPFELKHLLEGLKQGIEFLHNCVSHPLLMSPTQRCMHIIEAWLRIKNSSMRLAIEKCVSAAYRTLKKKQFSWIARVQDNDFRQVLHYRTLPPSPAYGDTEFEFLRFCRNAIVHIREHASLSDEQIDNYLKSVVPEFMLLLHDALTVYSSFL